ncbi:MAG: DUF1328 domain-containing protein [Luteolibacter sp.]
MFYRTVVFLLVAFISGVLGFGPLGGDPAMVARFLCAASLLLAVVCLSWLAFGDSP